MSHKDRITIEPGKRGGRPRIRGQRITVGDILEYLAGGITEAELLADFPYLEHEDILACFEYAADRERNRRLASTSCAITGSSARVRASAGGWFPSPSLPAR